MLMGVIGNEELFYDNIAHLITRSIVGVVELENKLNEYNIEKEDLLSFLQPLCMLALWPSVDNNIEKTLKKIELLKEKQKEFERFRLISIYNVKILNY